MQQTGRMHATALSPEQALPNGRGSIHHFVGVETRSGQVARHLNLASGRSDNAGPNRMFLPCVKKSSDRGAR